MPLSNVGRIIRYWRKKRGMSQEELARVSGVSARHISFMETGRAEPGRDVLDWVAQALELHDTEKTALMEAAGYMSSHVPVDMETAAAIGAMAAVELIASQALPLPCLVHDHMGNVLLTNRTFDAIISSLVDDTWVSAPSNGHELLFTALKPHIQNWGEVARTFRQRVVSESLRGTEQDEAMDALTHNLDAAIGDATLERLALPLPLMPVVLKLEGQKLKFQAVTMTLGVPQHIHLRPFRIETFYATDPATREVLERINASGGPATQRRR